MYIYCHNNPIKYIDPNGENSVAKNDHSFTDYNIEFKVVTKSRITIYETFSNGGASNTINSNTELKVIGGRDSKFAVKHNGNTRFVNKNDVKPFKELNAYIYYIKNVHTRKFMDVAGAGTSDGTAVQQHQFNASYAQQWRVATNNEGFQKLEPQNARDKRLSVKDVSDAKKNGKKAFITTKKTAREQDFIVIQICGEYMILSRESVFNGNIPKALEIGYFSNSDNGRPVQLWTADQSNERQRWDIRLDREAFGHGQPGARPEHGSMYKISNVRGFGVPNRTFSIQRIGATTNTTEWINNINFARDAWNNSGAGVNISITTNTAPTTIQVVTKPKDEWAGCAWGNHTVELNLSHIGPNTNFRRGVIAHEIGHLLWLGDTPPHADDSLMRGASTHIFVPQPYDVRNVLYVYE